MVKRFLGVHRIKNDVPLSAFRNPSTSVKKFCEVPVDHYFTLQAIPGFRTDFMFVTALKEHNINNPLDLVNYLRYATRGRRRLGVNVMASILVDFFQEVAEESRLREKGSHTTASICIAIVEAKLYYGASNLSFTSLPPLYS